MFNTIINSSVYSVNFYHKQNCELMWQSRDGISVEPRCGTVCVIYISTAYGPEIVVSGESLVHPNDSFSRAEGRKHSLKDALGYFDRETRSLFWNSYWSTVNKGKQ